MASSDGLWQSDPRALWLQVHPDDRPSGETVGDSGLLSGVSRLVILHYLVSLLIDPALIEARGVEPNEAKKGV